MFGKSTPEVLIVGAGPVGLFAALSLVERDVKVRIVDHAVRSATHSYALVLHGEALGYLAELGMLDQVLEGAYRVERVAFYDGSLRRAEIDLSSLGGPYGFLAVTRQDVLENLLERELRGRGVEVEWNHRAARLEPRADGVGVSIEKLVSESVGYAVSHTEWVVGKRRSLEVPFIVGADGYGSLVRRQLEIEFPEVGSAEQFAVFEFDSDFDARNEMRVILDDQSTNVLWPLPDGRVRWSFEISASRLPQEVRRKDRAFADLGSMRFPVLDASLLSELLAERAQWFDGSLGSIHWRMAVRFERRLAERFGQGRIWLAGDAGHMAGPVGAQSMNVGLREARDLALIVEKVLKRGEGMDRFAAYDRERRAEWRALLGLHGELRGGEGWLGGVAPRLVPCVPASGKALAALLGRLGLEWTAAPSEKS
jgi:2-polyprenyl-6-methoxyphenol hydroxylase-like FAD-dependent oxidoreductase